jgi:hypothetical protein
MSIDLHRVSRRRWAGGVLTALCVAASAFLGLTPTATAADGSAGYDRSLNEASCDLLGRVYTKGAGCSRTKCVDGATLFRKVFGAEACQLKGQGDYGFVATIDYRRCTDLGRRWISQVNFCASYPERSVTAVYDAPQCVSPRSVYVPNTEADGFYDECLTPARVLELVGFARTSSSNLTAEASLRSSVQCQDRPAMSFVDGRCVANPGSVPAKGGVLMVGDSLTWRGTDELGKLRGTFTLDGEPARQISELQGRLDYYVAGHGQPSSLIVALGAVPPPKGYGKSDLLRTIKSVPRSTKIMFVAPYATLPSGKTSPRTVTIGGWMTSIAKSRGRACVAPWPSFVMSHRGMLQDGVHVKHSQEKTWAKFIDQQWGHC